MKRFSTRLFAAGTILALALSLAACGGSADNSPEAVLDRAQAAMEDISSMHYTLDMDIGMTAEGESLEITTTGEADCVIDPMTLGMDLHMSLAGLMDMDMKMYMVQEGDSYLVYSGVDDGAGNLTWTKETMEDLAALAQYDGKASMELYLENGTSFTEAGEEDVEGVTATRYDGVITGDSLEAVMDSSGVMDQFSALGLEGMEDLYSEMGDLPVSIWIDKATDLPVKYEMDMTDMMKNMMDKLMAQDEEAAEAGITIDKCAMVMVCSDFNAIDSIEIPQEALDAPSSDQLAGDLLLEEEDQAIEEAQEEAS